jgi:Na+-transporting methylmalonyl-CoA/oxaloacetate decarboxylase gamma subunit
MRKSVSIAIKFKNAKEGAKRGSLLPNANSTNVKLLDQLKSWYTADNYPRILSLSSVVMMRILLILLLLLVYIEWCLSTQSPTRQSTSDPEKVKEPEKKAIIEEAKRGKKRARDEFERYLTNFEEAHPHVPIGNSHRLKWMDLLSQRQKEEANIRRHKLTAKLIKEPEQISHALNQRAEELEHIPKKIKERWNLLKHKEHIILHMQKNKWISFLQKEKNKSDQ